MRVLLAVLVAATVALTPAALEAQDSTATDEAADVEEMAVAPDVADEVLTRLDSLVAHSARGVESGAEFVWPIMVRQQKIEGLIGVAVLGFFFVLFLSGLYLWVGGVGPTDRGGSVPGQILTSVGGIMGLLTLLFVLLAGSITQLLNPHYHALMDIMKAVGLQ